MKEKYTVKFYWSNGMVDREVVVTVKHWLEAVAKARKLAFERTRYLGNGVRLCCYVYPFMGEPGVYLEEDAVWCEYWMRHVSKEDANIFGK